MRLRCHWDRTRVCRRAFLCRTCSHQPLDEDKPNGRKPPVKLLWKDTINYFSGEFIPNGEPECPSCGEMPYSTERCIFCGQKFLQTDQQR